MKTISAMMLLSFSVSSFAGQNWMYCKDAGQRINLDSADGYRCATALLTGKACFTGDRARTVGFLNTPIVRQFFDGTDGEYIKDARGNELGYVTYTTVDEPNHESSTQTMKRCTNDFFFN